MDVLKVLVPKIPQFMEIYTTLNFRSVRVLVETYWSARSNRVAYI